jgi:O-antigen ligase
MQTLSISRSRIRPEIGKRKKKDLFEQFIPILGMVGSNFFYVMASIFGFEYTGIENSRSYLIYVVLVLVANFVLFSKSFTVGKGRISSKEFLMFLILSVVFLSYITPSLFTGRVNATATTFFMYFVAFSLPAIFAAIYTSKFRALFKIAKLLEIVMLLLTTSIIIKVIIPYFQGQRLLTFAGAVYHQTGSYLAAFAFGLNLYFLFEGWHHERFSLFKSLFYKYFCYLLLIIQVIGFVLPGGRGGVVLGAAYFIYIILSQITRKNLRTLAKVVIFVVFFAAVIILSWPSLMQNDVFRIGYMRATQFIAPGGGINWEGTSGRNVLYLNTIHLIEQRPVLGYGLYGMWDVINYYPHNLFLEVLLQGGIVYLIIFSWILLLFIRKLLRMTKTDGRYRILQILLLYPFVMLMFSGTYLNTPQFWFVLVFVLTS